MIAQAVTISALVSTMLFLVLVTVGRTLAGPRPTRTKSLLLPQRGNVAREAIMGQIRAVKIMPPLQMITEVPPAKAWNQGWWYPRHSLDSSRQTNDTYSNISWSVSQGHGVLTALPCHEIDDSLAWNYSILEDVCGSLEYSHEIKFFGIYHMKLKL
jgi:hypothetical protein